MGGHWDWNQPPKGWGGRKRGSGGRRRRRSSSSRRSRSGKTILGTGNAWDRAMQGTRGVRTYTPYRQVKDLIKTQMKAHGLTERNAIRAVANALGVKQRTVRSWVHPVKAMRRSPSKRSGQRIQAAHNTPERRRATMAGRKAAAMAKNGMRVKLTGNVGPRIGGKDYTRFRTITNLWLPPEAAEHVMDVYAESGPEAADEALREAMREHYDRDNPTDWTFSELTEMRFGAADPDEAPEWFRDMLDGEE